MSEAVEDEVATKLQAGYRLAEPFKIPLSWIFDRVPWNFDTIVGILNFLFCCKNSLTFAQFVLCQGHAGKGRNATG